MENLWYLEINVTGDTFLYNRKFTKVMSHFNYLPHRFHFLPHLVGEKIVLLPIVYFSLLLLFSLSSPVRHFAWNKRRNHFINR